MKSRSSESFRSTGQLKRMRREFRKEQEQDAKLTPSRSDAMIKGYEFIDNFMRRGQQVVAGMITR